MKTLTFEHNSAQEAQQYFNIFRYAAPFWQQFFEANITLSAAIMSQFVKLTKAVA